MSKICCIEDADVSQKSSSCSMILRSACSHHKHSRESPTVKKHSHSSTHKRILEGHFNDNFEIAKSSNQNSFEVSALKSSKVAKSSNQNSFEVSALNVSCTREINFSQLSASDISYVYNNLNHKERSSDYSSATESDINSSASFDPTSEMSSKSQRFTRSSLSSVRSLSGSEDESDITVEKITRPHRTLSVNTNFKNRRNVSSEEMKSLHSSNSHSYTERHHSVNNNIINRYNGSSDGDSILSSMTESARMDNSSVQYSLFDRFRWFLWRCIYLKLIKCVNFDVWLLSRIHNYGKLKAILFLLLPVLLFLVWSLLQNNPFSREALYETSSSIISAVLAFFSAIFSLLSSTFSSIIQSVYSSFQQEEVVSASETSDSSCLAESAFFSSLSSLFTFFSGWLGKLGENAYSTTETNPTKEPFSKEALYLHNEENKYFHHNEETKYFQTSREEVKILASEVLKEEIKSLKEFFKSSVQKSESEKLKKDQKLQKEIKNLQFEFQSLSETMGRLEKDIMKQSENVETNEEISALKTEYKSHIEDLNVKLKTIEAKLGVLGQLKNCCDKQWNEDDLAVLLEKHLIIAFKNVVDGDSKLTSKYNFFTEWLNSKFFSHEKLKQEINAALKAQSSSSSDSKVNFDTVTQVVETTVLKYVDSIKRNLSEISKSTYSSFSEDIFSDDRIKKIVKEAIMLYDADKIGQVDYALESGGGSVLGTRCSETYVEKYGKLSVFGVPLWTNSNSPRTAIQPDVQPGRCWAFKGSQGFLVLELSATIYPTGFTLEHIPVSLSPSGSIDSAPKNFSVWGLDSDKDSKGYLLGEYMYDISGDPLQYFAVKIPSDKPYTYIELQIHSNHGNMEYTCLYRFRVHGKRVR